MRPERPLAAGFFDRLELLRRVALSEIAKASNMVEVTAAVGVVFDREMLLVAAEELYSREAARSKVFHQDFGNYEELAADMGATMKRSRGTRVAKKQQGWRGAQATTLSKPRKPYAEPFRLGGVKLLLEAWRSLLSSHFEGIGLSGQ